MPSKKEIKLRIESVTTTRQVVKAMNMVAASRHQRLKAQLDTSRQLYGEAERMMTSIRGSFEARNSEYFRPKKVGKKAIVVVVGDRGLCGSYNTNVLNTALSYMEAKEEQLVVIGIKGKDFFARYNKDIVRHYPGSTESNRYDFAMNIGAEVESWYRSGVVDEIHIVYTHYETPLSYIPRAVKLLPLAAGANEGWSTHVIFEPNATACLQSVISKYLGILVFNSIVESNTCEQASRMVNMNAASNSASDIIVDLTRSLNRKRQAAITQEISEIINSANMTK